MSHPSVQKTELKQSIEDFCQHVRTYQSTLKQQATWLLLATFGCWSVVRGPFQWIAYGLTLLIFAERIRERMGDQRSFMNIKEAIVQRIQGADLADESKKALLWDLNQMLEAENGARVAMRRNVIFLCCWTFFGVSFLAATPLGRFIG